MKLFDFLKEEEIVFKPFTPSELSLDELKKRMEVSSYLQLLLICYKKGWWDKIIEIFKNDLISSFDNKYFDEFCFKILSDDKKEIIFEIMKNAAPSKIKKIAKQFLLNAIWKKMPQWVMYFIKYDIDVKNAPFLINACVVNNEKIVKILIENGADINQKLEYSGDTPLHIACGIGNAKIVKILLSQPQIDVNVQNNKLETPLHKACKSDPSVPDPVYSKIIKLLLNHPKIDINIADENKRTPFFNACEKDNKEIAELLINKGAKIDVVDNLGYTPFLITISKEKINTFDLLLKKGIFPTQKDFEHACLNENEEMAYKILKVNKQIDVNQGIYKQYEEKPLLIFCKIAIPSQWIYPLIELLIKRGANVNVQDREGMTPLMHICNVFNREEKFKVFELLLKSGADINIKDKQNRSVLTIIFSKSLEKIDRLMDILLENGIEINLNTVIGMDVIIAAFNNIYLFELLLNKKIINPNFAFKNKQNNDTLLHLACRLPAKIEIVNLLLDNGAEINSKNKNGETALMLSCKQNDLKKVELLLQRGADINLKDNSGKTALDYAQNPKIFNLLKLHKSNKNT